MTRLLLTICLLMPVFFAGSAIPLHGKLVVGIHSTTHCLGEIMHHDNEAPVKHYTLRHRVEAWISQNVFSRVTYKVRRGLLKGMKRKGGLAWIPDSLIPDSETAETRFWKSTSFDNLVVYDVGAFHGLLTLHFARTAKQVISFEPSSKNHKVLAHNLRLNRIENVEVVRYGVGAESRECELVGSNLMPGGNSLDSKIAQSIRESPGCSSEWIPIRSLDALIQEHELPKPDFIKIDVEGFEAEVLRGAQNVLSERHPKLFLEMHGETMGEKRRKVHEIVEILTALGYDRIEHIESHALVSLGNTETAAQGHLYATKQK